MDTIKPNDLSENPTENQPGPPTLLQATRPKRRKHSRAVKREMVEATLSGKESVSVVARRYDVNANQLFLWRKQYQAGLLDTPPESAVLLPIEVQDSTGTEVDPRARYHPNDAERGRLEITFASGHHVVITGMPCQHALQTTLEVLSR